MKPVDFPESNRVLKRPQGMTEEECVDLPVAVSWRGECISCWQGTLRERLRFLFTGRLWVRVWSGQTQPPICPDVQHPWRQL